MDRFGRMQKHRGRPCAREGRDDLLGDPAGLSDSGDDDFSAMLCDHLNGARKLRIEAASGQGDAIGLGIHGRTAAGHGIKIRRWHLYQFSGIEAGRSYRREIQPAILASATGDMVSSSSAYSRGAPVLAVWKR